MFAGNRAELDRTQIFRRKLVACETVADVLNFAEKCQPFSLRNSMKPSHNKELPAIAFPVRECETGNSGKVDKDTELANYLRSRFQQVDRVYLLRPKRPFDVNPRGTHLRDNLMVCTGSKQLSNRLYVLHAIFELFDTRFSDHRSIVYSP